MTASRPCAVGVTGHRPNRLAIGQDVISGRLEVVLAALKQEGCPVPNVALSALAEGADRLFAVAALSLGYRLEVVLPFKSPDYETTFGDQTTMPAYRDLLVQAASVTELTGELSDSKAAYEVVGHEIVARSNVIVAVWDGKPAAGRGGTPDIIENAISSSKPVIWIDALHDRQPLVLRTHCDGDPNMSLNCLAAKAKPLTKAEIATFFV